LRSLELTKNLLAEVPLALAGLVNLVNLGLRDNPLIQARAELERASVRDIRTLARNIGGRRAEPLYELKLLFVGEGGVGKSCLLAALQERRPKRNMPTTHGIHLSSITFLHPDDERPVTLRTWDFGGQELYRITHQFFYSEQSICIVVWNPREGKEENAVEFWLERLHLRLRNKSKVFVVATHAGAESARRADIDESGLRAKFPGMIAQDGFFHVDSFTGLGIAPLMKAIQKAAVAEVDFPHMGRPFPTDWRAVSDALSARKEMYISRAEVDRICGDNHLEKNSAEALLRILHIRGRVVCYSDDDTLNKYIVLNPEWLTKAISFVLEDHETAKDGYLEHSRLSAIWSDHQRANEPRYPPELHSFLLRLMETFDVSYRVREEEGKRSLIGQMVPYEPPKLKKMADGRQLRVMYDMRTSPPGLMPWLIVRTHRFAANRLHWRRGTSLLHRERTALLTLDAQDRRLELIVSLGVFTIHLPQLRERGEDRDVPPVCQPAARSGVAAILRSRSLVCVGSRAILMVWVGHEAQDQLEFPAMRYASRARKRHLAATCHFPRVFQGFRG
jgi:hypothetical protein